LILNLAVVRYLGAVPVIRIADLEGLIKKYLEEERFEYADALYLCATIRSLKVVSDTMSIRYKTIAPLTVILEDLKQFGIDDLSKLHSYLTVVMETREYIGDVIRKIFRNLCLNELLKRVEERAKRLSRVARELLFLLSVLGPDDFKDKGRLKLVYRLIFQRELDPSQFKAAIEELIACYVLHGSPEYYEVSEFYDLILLRLSEYLPRVEVKVVWPEVS